MLEVCISCYLGNIHMAHTVVVTDVYVLYIFAVVNRKSYHSYYFYLIVIRLLWYQSLIG